MGSYLDVLSFCVRVRPVTFEKFFDDFFVDSFCYFLLKQKFSSAPDIPVSHFRTYRLDFYKRLDTKTNCIS